MCDTANVYEIKLPFWGKHSANTVRSGTTKRAFQSTPQEPKIRRSHPVASPCCLVASPGGSKMPTILLQFLLSCQPWTNPKPNHPAQGNMSITQWCTFSPKLDTSQFVHFAICEDRFTRAAWIDCISLWSDWYEWDWCSGKHRPMSPHYSQIPFHTEWRIWKGMFAFEPQALVTLKRLHLHRVSARPLVTSIKMFVPVSIHVLKGKLVAPRSKTFAVEQAWTMGDFRQSARIKRFENFDECLIPHLNREGKSLFSRERRWLERRDSRSKPFAPNLAALRPSPSSKQTRSFCPVLYRHIFLIMRKGVSAAINGGLCSHFYCKLTSATFINAASSQAGVSD